jgi:predicted dehydrogenase
MDIGIIGYGRIGNEHAGWIAQSSLGRVAKVFDPTPQRRAVAEARGLHVVDDVDDLLSDPEIPAVLIATPTSMHTEHTLRALRAGKHVMVEKPMTLMLSEAQLVAEEAHKHRRVLNVFQCRRWDIDYLTIKSTIASGALGRIFNVESRLGQWASCVGPAAKEWRPGWRNEAAFGGGGLYDWGSHFVDQLWRLMLPAKPLRVFAQLRGNVWTRDCDDFARVIIDFDNGAAGMVEINTTTTQPLPRWHVDGERGSAKSDSDLSFDTRKWAQFRFISADGTARQLPLAEPGLSEPEIWRQFILACDGKQTSPIPVETVLPTMALLDAARQSSATGRVVDLDPFLQWME